MTRKPPALAAGALALGALSLLAAGPMAGCDSQAALTANPGATLNSTPVTARYVPAAATMYFDRSTMPQSLLDASSLKVVLGSTPIPVMQASATESMVLVPQTAPLDPDTQGKQNLVFILDRAQSQVVEIQITR